VPKTRLISFATDEPFQRFFATFEGLISKLSAPLAFASLPLGIDSAHRLNPSSQKSAADTKLDRRSVPAHPPTSSQTEPEVSKLISGAALRAIRDKNGPAGTLGYNNTAESFYVVPTSGGMISYAGILSRAEKEARRNSLDDNDEDFVDARENPPSPEDLHNIGGDKRVGRNAPLASDSPGWIRGTKTMEELQMENHALKQLSDTLAKRLHMWEVNAQSSSLALQQSLKAMHHQSAASPARQVSPSSSTARPPPLTPSTAAAMGSDQQSPSTGISRASPTTTETDTRIRELEELLTRGEKELERVSRENDKLRGVVGRYRERWEKLKEGARVRREGNGNVGGNGNGA
jgi:hypothetical protein